MVVSKFGETHLIRFPITLLSLSGLLLLSACGDGEGDFAGTEETGGSESDAAAEFGGEEDPSEGQAEGASQSGGSQGDASSGGMGDTEPGDSGDESSGGETGAWDTEMDMEDSGPGDSGVPEGGGDDEGFEDPADNWRDRYDPEKFREPCTTPVEFVNDEPEGRGKVFTETFPDAQAFIDEWSMMACAILYRDPSEAPTFPKIRVTLSSSFDGTGRAGGIPAVPPFREADAFVDISLRWLGDIQNNEAAAIKWDLELVFSHELAHVYQAAFVPGMIPMPQPVDVVEGVADFVRMHGGRIRNYNPPVGGAWDGGYEETAYFLDWLDRMYPDIVYRLNKHMAEGMFDQQFFMDETGSSVEDLWDMYQADMG